MRGASDEKSNFQFFYTKMPNMPGLRKSEEAAKGGLKGKSLC